jgi:hypothetical protein
VSFQEDVVGTGVEYPYGNQGIPGGTADALYAQATGPVSGDVSPIHRFLGTDGVCGRGVVSETWRINCLVESYHLGAMWCSGDVCMYLFDICIGDDG